MGQLSGLTGVALEFLVVGLTVWWFVTMLPFVLLVTPPLIRAAASAFPSVIPDDVRLHGLRGELPERGFALSMLVPGIAVVLLGASVTCTSLGSFMSASFGAGTRSLVELMAYLSGGALSIMGSTILIRK